MVKGWWANHTYHRVSVEDIEEFVGWNFLLELTSRAEQTQYAPGYEHLRERDKALIATLFETGGRVSEVLTLRKHNFDLHQSPEHIIVKGMTLLKRKKKTTRGTFPILRKEPLVPFMENWINQAEDYLFPGQSKKRPYLTATRVYQIVMGLGVDLHTNPHWFRGSRASQLAAEYGFKIHDLMEFFSWKKADTAAHYAHLGWRDLANKMKG